VTKLEELLDRHERKTPLTDDVEKAYLLEYVKLMKKNGAAEALVREVHFLLNTPLRRMQDSLLRVAAALRAYASEKERTLWNEGAPEEFSVGCVVCEWENGHTDNASTHHYVDGTSAWIPQGTESGEVETSYRRARVTRWRWAGPEVPAPDSAVRIWKWREAPGELRALSTHGGDEDWVCLVPKEMVGDYLPFVDALGVCRVSEHTFMDGRKVFIGAHA
jgi:hypothetical protein